MSSFTHPHARSNNCNSTSSSLSRARFHQRITMDRLLCLFVTTTALSVLLTLVHHCNLPSAHSSSSISSSNQVSQRNDVHDRGGSSSVSEKNAAKSMMMMMMIPPRQWRHHELLWKSGNQAVQVEKKDKKGKVVHHSITHLKAEDLNGLGADNSNSNQNLTLEEASQGREELLAILHDAGVHDMDAAAIAQLPTWQQVTRLYGTSGHPIIYGLETCASFRQQTPREDISVGTAGLFNTGTNPLSMYLQANCEIPSNTGDKFKGMRWQVPVRMLDELQVLSLFFSSPPHPHFRISSGENTCWHHGNGPIQLDTKARSTRPTFCPSF
jgi:hypothetical protein